MPGCTVCQAQCNAAVAINIVAAGHFGILFSQVDYYAAAICCINITFDSAACFAAVYSNVAAVSIDAAVNSQCAVVAINIHITVFACIDCSVSTADSAAAVQGYVAVCCIDANITANIGVALNSNICTICIDAGFTLQLQLSLGGVDYDVFIGCTYCGAFFNLDLSRILSEYIGAVFLQNAVFLILVICLSIAGDTAVELAALRSLGFRIGEARLHGTVLQAALTSISIEGDVAGMHSLAACGQAISNLYVTGQVLLTVYKIAVSQLAGQCVQNISYAYPVIHINTAVVGNHGYYRACCRTLDNGVACCVVFSCFTIAGMSVEDVSVAAVVVNGQVSAILLEDIACCCFAVSACELSYMAAAEATVCFAPNLIIPGCAVIQVHIDNAIILRECNAGQGGFLVRQANINHAIFAISTNIATDNRSHSARSCLIIIHIYINNAAVSQQAIAGVSLAIPSLDCATANIYSRAGIDSCYCITISAAHINISFTVYINRSTLICYQTMNRSSKIKLQVKITVNIYTAVIVGSMNTIGYSIEIVLGINCSFSCCDINSTIFYRHTGTIIITAVRLTDYKLTCRDFSGSFSIMLKGFFFRPVTTCSNNAQLVVGCINCQCFFDVSSSSCAYGNCRIAVKEVFTISNIACVFRICFKVAGNSSGKCCFR